MIDIIKYIVHNRSKLRIILKSIPPFLQRRIRNWHFRSFLFLEVEVIKHFYHFFMFFWKLRFLIFLFLFFYLFIPQWIFRVFFDEINFNIDFFVFLLLLFVLFFGFFDLSLFNLDNLLLFNFLATKVIHTNILMKIQLISLFAIILNRLSVRSFF